MMILDSNLALTPSLSRRERGSSSNSLLKNAVLAFFNPLRRGTCPRLAPEFKYLRI
jgi:hypothetical protein